MRANELGVYADRWSKYSYLLLPETNKLKKVTRVCSFDQKINYLLTQHTLRNCLTTRNRVLYNIFWSSDVEKSNLKVFFPVVEVPVKFRTNSG